MEREIEKKKAAVADFRKKVSEAHKLLEEIGNLDDELSWRLYNELIVGPGNRWRKMGSGVVRSQFFHAFISSTTDWGNSPDLDLSGGLIEKYLNEVVLPKLINTLKELKNPAK